MILVVPSRQWCQMFKTHNCHHFVVVGRIMPFRISFKSCKRQLDVNHPQTFESTPANTARGRVVFGSLCQRIGVVNLLIGYFSWFAVGLRSAW